MPFYIFCTIVLNYGIVAEMTCVIVFPLPGFLLYLNTPEKEVPFEPALSKVL